MSATCLHTNQKIIHDSGTGQTTALCLDCGWYIVSYSPAGSLPGQRFVVSGSGNASWVINQSPPVAQPDLPLIFSTDPIVAWRTWQVWTQTSVHNPSTGTERPVLGAIAQQEAWPPLQPMEGRCLRNPEHQAPDRNCQCGCWAIKEDFPPAGYEPYAKMVVGRVRLWGRVLEYDKGYRSQYAYPLDLYGDESIKGLLVALGGKYQIPTYFLPAAEFPSKVGKLLERDAEKMTPLKEFKAATRAATDEAKEQQKILRQKNREPSSAVVPRLHVLETLMLRALIDLFVGINAIAGVIGLTARYVLKKKKARRLSHEEYQAKLRNEINELDRARKEIDAK